MGDTLLTALLMENHHPSTVLSMDSSASSSHDDLDLEISHHVVLTRPPDINLPFPREPSPPPQPWNAEHCDILDVGLGTHAYETETHFTFPKTVKKCSKRVDSIWGAWFFFSFYFKPVLNEKSKAKIIHDSNGVSGFNKSDLQLDIFMVQHDMENMYMWVFKERPENALGKMQLRSYMNGHSRQGERPFPFSADKGFVRSHRMQRKHYRGLSNPQCVHGVEVVPSPSLACLNEDDRKRWIELTGRDLKFTIPPDASAYGLWRNLPSTEFELEKPPPPLVKANNHHSHSKKLLNGSVLNLSSAQNNNNNGEVMDLSPVNNKRKKDFFFSQENFDDDCHLTMNRMNGLENNLPSETHWSNGFSGVLRNTSGPVTAAKTIYEDDQGYLIVMSLPFVDFQRVKVSWKNTSTHGIIKVCCVSTSCSPFIKRQNRIFKIMDMTCEHCPPGEFIREISLPTRIPEDAKIEAYHDELGTVLEVLVPKFRQGPEEHEVRVCLRPRHHGVNDLE